MGYPSTTGGWRMQTTNKDTSGETADVAASRLAMIVGAELGVAVTSEDIRRLIRTHWHRLSPLAHIVHRDVE